jgi:hypothetical protein
MNTRRTERTSVFISYSRRDARWLERLQIHLEPLRREYNIAVWDDTTIQSGADWREEVESALKSAKVAILLVSADFMASRFIAQNELPPLLDAAEHEGVVILPVILTHSSFDITPSLSRFHAMNNPAKPLAELRTAARAAVWEKVARRVAEVLRGAPPAGGGAARPARRSPPRWPSAKRSSARRPETKGRRTACRPRPNC